MEESLMRRWLYLAVLRLHPRGFRARFGEEMSAAFDEASRAGNAGPLLADGLRSLLRQWILRPAIPALAAPRVSADAPMFYSLDGDTPSRSALWSGGFVAVAVFAAMIVAMGLSTRRGGWADRLMGSHNVSRSHLLGVRSAATAESDLATKVEVKREPEDPELPPYFRRMPVLMALDRNRDGVISMVEIEDAAAALRTLDKDGDGKLSAAECGARSAGLAARFMRIHPVLAAIDVNEDGEISAAEIRNAPAALRTLDRNHDGMLTLDELYPRRVRP
jgi:hypothetical protein